MSSDYISRLRAELLRAGAPERAPRRRAGVVRGLRPLGAAVAVGLLVAAIMLTLPGGGRDELPAPGSGDAVTLTYRLQTGDVSEAAQIVRDRLKAAGITAEVTTGDRTLTIVAPDAARAEVTALTVPGHFAILDWEASVLGPDGRPAPTDPHVTGGPGAGQESALTEAEARSRAAKRPGARAFRAERGSGWFALAGNPEITNADVASALAGEDPVDDSPIATFEFTPSGQQAFQTLTRELSRRGADQAGSGDPLETSQHMVFVLDDRILSTPFINWREAPDGIDGARGGQVSGLATPDQARLTAALLSAGPLPGTLEPIPG